MSGSFSLITDEQAREFYEIGYLCPVPVLSPEEAASFRRDCEATRTILGESITRVDGLEWFVTWVWQLTSHPRLLDQIERLVGPNIILQSTRLFYKHPKTGTYVGLHQDGYTQSTIRDEQPNIWLALSEATSENGCLQVVPGSHRLGPLLHDQHAEYVIPEHVQARGFENAYEEDPNEVSGVVARVPNTIAEPVDMLLQPGQMSIHHPLALHGSLPNRSDGPRIGLSATYSSPAANRRNEGVHWVRGPDFKEWGFEPASGPDSDSLEAQLALYLGSGRQVCFLPETSAESPGGGSAS